MTWVTGANGAFTALGDGPAVKKRKVPDAGEKLAISKHKASHAPSFCGTGLVDFHAELSHG